MGCAFVRLHWHGKSYTLYDKHCLILNLDFLFDWGMFETFRGMDAMRMMVWWMNRISFDLMLNWFSFGLEDMDSFLDGYFSVHIAFAFYMPVRGRRRKEKSPCKAITNNVDGYYWSMVVNSSHTSDSLTYSIRYLWKIGHWMRVCLLLWRVFVDSLSAYRAGAVQLQPRNDAILVVNMLWEREFHFSIV